MKKMSWEEAFQYFAATPNCEGLKRSDVELVDGGRYWINTLTSELVEAAS